MRGMLNEVEQKSRATGRQLASHFGGLPLACMKMREADVGGTLFPTRRSSQLMIAEPPDYDRIAFA
jgi:hypothetical protein